MENNQAFVAKLTHIQPIPGADRIVQADVTLNGIKITQVVVGKDTIENTPVVYFDSNLCINQNVIDMIDSTNPDYGKEGFLSLGNYLSKGNRVRVIKLKGIISNGLAVETYKFLPWIDKDQLVEGFSFTALGDTEICHKYVVPVRSQSNHTPGSKKKLSINRILPDQFRFHVDTEQLPRNMNKIFPEQVISISRKVHGTSAIVQNCKVIKTKLSFKEKIAKFLLKQDITEYDYIYASRKVIKNNRADKGFYGEDLWTDVAKEFFYGRLHQGETIYYEIVGYTPSGKEIQKGYHYDCAPGSHKIAVYRITGTGNDGTVYEYSWQAMKSRCQELGVPTVQEYFFGDWNTLYPEFIKQSDPNASAEALEAWRSKILAQLRIDFLEKDAPDCDNNPDEGIVIRIEGLNIEAYKLKSEKFLLREVKEAEAGTIDMEDTQVEEES